MPMNKPSITLSNTFNRFFESEKSSGILLIVLTLASILLTNSTIEHGYLSLWQIHVAGLSLEHWINDGLMAIFFLLIGLELEREIYVGELSHLKNALLPIFAAIGGMLVPALIHYSLNQSTPTVNGIGIPMATDIAFALGVLAILGNKIPASLKVFVVAFAVIDDLGAIVLIAFFYTAKFSVSYLLAALLVWAVLILLNRLFRVMSLLPYIVGGIIMWFFMLKSGIHATVAGIMLAFAIPFSVKDDDHKSPSHKLEHFLHKPVAFIILPIFALANTGITIEAGWMNDLMSANSLGIMLGLILGKPLGVSLFCCFAVITGICHLPADLKWLHIVGAGILGGIGFTMSIFITNLAFPASVEIINAAKMAILFASLSAGVLGFIWFKFFAKTAAS
jgi:NhaA family Na+:H+ antiporter